MSVLTAEVERGETGAVGGVDIGSVLAQQRRRLAVAPPCYLVQCTI